MPNGTAATVFATSVGGGTASGHLKNWRVLAACRSAEPDLFFPAAPAELTGGQAERAGGQAERAKAFCGTCSVRRECLQFALATRQPYGVWGGMSEHERHVAHHQRPA